MDVWHVILYAGASFLALRSLVSLMTQHRSAFRRKVVERGFDDKPANLASGQTGSDDAAA